MNLPQGSEEKAYSAMRSLFRYLEFKKMECPNILIEFEEKILAERFKNLNPEEICFVVNQWPNYYKEQLVETEIQSNQVMAMVEKEIGNLN